MTNAIGEILLLTWGVLIVSWGTFDLTSSGFDGLGLISQAIVLLAFAVIWKGKP